MTNPNDDDVDEHGDERPDHEDRAEPTKEEKQMALFCHLGGIVGGFVVPLVIWIIKKDESKFIDHHGKEALNFNITLLIAYSVIGAATCGIGIFAIFPISIVFFVMAAMAANKGEAYKYPLNIRIIT